MRSRTSGAGRHRLGMVNGVHCIRIPAVAAALAEHRRNWFTALLNPARHSFAAMSKRSSTVGAAHWVPATAG